MINALRFVEKTLEDGRKVKILQYQEAYTIVTSEVGNIEAGEVSEWQDVDLCLNP